MKNRWDSMYRHSQEVSEAIPANKRQASIFLDNAYWHVANLGGDMYDAKQIIHDAYMSIVDEKSVAA